MSLAQKDFDALVARMERMAKDRPQAYTRRVFGLAALGYGYVAFIVLVLLGLAGLAAASVMYLKLFGIKLLIVVGAVLWAVLKSLWVKLDPPTDPVVTRAEAPALFEMLDGLRAKLKTPVIYQVQITHEFNAGVMQIPRLGLFGWHQSYLQIGLPLMRALSVPQFEAVLGHELGHLSHGHARVANWIYRLRMIWVRLEQALSSGRAQWGSWLTGPFYRWYVPYFRACSFPLARANEYEADAAAARATSPTLMAEALTSVQVIGAWMSEHYWPGVHAAAKESPQPAFAPYSQLDPSAIRDVPAAEAQQWLESALARQTGTEDTHPALADRLAAMGTTAVMAVPNASDRADQLLGTATARLARHFDETWREGIAESWRQFHERVQKDRETLATLRTQAGKGDMEEDPSLERARLEESVGEGEVVALALRRQLRERFPDSIGVQFALGRQLVMGNDAEGVALVEGAVSHEQAAILPGSALLRDYFWRQGDKESATEWHAKYVERAKILQAAEAERASVLLTDPCEPHGLDEAQRASLLAQFKGVSPLNRVYMARKVVKYFPERPLYLVGVRATPWYRWKDKAWADATVAQLRQQVEWPGEAIIVSVEGTYRKFGPKLKRIQGSLVYQA